MVSPASKTLLTSVRKCLSQKVNFPIKKLWDIKKWVSLHPLQMRFPENVWWLKGSSRSWWKSHMVVPRREKITFPARCLPIYLPLINWNQQGYNESKFHRFIPSKYKLVHTLYISHWDCPPQEVLKGEKGPSVRASWLVDGLYYCLRYIMVWISE